MTGKTSARAFWNRSPTASTKALPSRNGCPSLIYEYYRISGRHEKTGRPYMDTLTRLGLEEFKQWSQLD